MLASRRARLALGIGTMSASLSCTVPPVSQDARDLGGGPILELVDTVLLDENDETFVGRVGDVLAHNDGTYLISDMRNEAIHHFAADGRHLASVGRRGEQAGDFWNPGHLVMASDSVLLVYDPAFIKALDYPGLTFQWQVPIPFHAIPHFTIDNAIVVSFVTSDQRSTLGTIDAGTDTIRAWGPYPEMLGRSGIINDNLGYQQAIRLPQSDSVALATLVSDYLFFGPIGGTKFDSIPVVVRKREGSRQDLLRTVTAEPASLGPVIYRSSVPWALAALDSSRIVYVTADQRVEPGRLSARLYVSVLDRATRRSCSDTIVPVPSDPMPWVTFRGDTLIVSVQDLGADERPYSALRRYHVNTAACRWATTSEVASAPAAPAIRTVSEAA